MNQSKPFGSATEPNAGTPAKSAAPAGSSGVRGKPVNTPAAPPVSPAPRPVAPTRSAAGASPKPATELPPAARARAKPDQPQPQAQGRTGKVVHDERGNAVWDWLKQTGRIAIESTTRMLRRLETPELKVEQPHEEELRIQPDAGTCSGGGYDPYNQPVKSRRTPNK
jgi:hypothetical protein